MDELKMPDTPLIVAGAAGGPMVMFTVTPMRNALTLGATNPTAGAMELYRTVFRGGFARGWTGGIFPSMAACPGFVALGPAYHFFASIGGVTGGVVAASCFESAILYGCETRNAQMAKNAQAPGTIASPHPAWKPFGPGIGLHISRNIIATAGLRMFCTPCTNVIESLTGTKTEGTQIAGSFCGNVVSACMTAPVHQMYGYTVSTPELAKLSTGEQLGALKQFMLDQYTVVSNGKRSIGATVPRDLFMRSMYVAVMYTMFSTGERQLVKNWPR